MIQNIPNEKVYCVKCKTLLEKIILAEKPEFEWRCKEHGKQTKALQKIRNGLGK